MDDSIDEFLRSLKAVADARASSFEEDKKKSRAKFEERVEKLASQDPELIIENAIRKVMDRPIRIVKVDALDSSLTKNFNRSAKPKS